MAQTALITGITGQDGTYLSELLVSKGYVIHGTIRPSSDAAVSEELSDRVTLHNVDLTTDRSVRDLLQGVQPDEIYNLAAISSLEESDAEPARTAEVNGSVPIRIITAIEGLGAQKETRFCQASSSQIFGTPDGRARDESTPIRPENPYAVAKAHAHATVASARTDKGLFGASAILFNHESPRRSKRFVSRKISAGVALIAAGKAHNLHLWNLESSRDWGFAGDYVRAMWLMLQHDEPDDFIVATGMTHTVGDFVAAAFAAAGISEWEPLVETGDGPIEVGSPGMATKARGRLGWVPEVSFASLVSLMVEHDRDLLDQGAPQHRS